MCGCGGGKGSGACACKANALQRSACGCNGAAQDPRSLPTNLRSVEARTCGCSGAETRGQGPSPKPPSVRTPRRPRPVDPSALLRSYAKGRAHPEQRAGDLLGVPRPNPRIEREGGAARILPSDAPPDKCGVGQLPLGGTILAGSNNVRPLSTPAKSRGDLLFPGFAISVTAEGDCTAFLDRACRQALADHGGVLRAVRQGTGVLGVRRTAKGWGEEVIPRASKSNGGATYLAASAGPGSGWPGDDGFPGDGFPGEESEPAAGMLRFSYRSEHFDVDEDWFWEWLIDWATIYRSNSASAGYVSSAEDTLDAVISQFRSEAYGDPEDYDVLMGCWNVHREAWEWDYLYYFWTEGWGAPREMFRLMAQMISTYWEDVDYTEFEDQELCEGFAEFVRKAVRGQTATRRNDHLEEGDFGYDWPESCYMVVNYRNKTDYERVRGACTLSGGATRDGTEETCNDYFDTNKPCDDEDWNELDPIYDPSSKCVKAFSDEATCAAPRALCSGGIGADWSITLPPRRVVFDGVTADWVLHLARMCFDYGRTLEFADFADYYTTAGRLGRYALGVAANAANVWIHEFGHTYLGGGHCSNDLNCCFDNAADAWQCRVRANLGLPLGPYDRHVFGQDFDNPDQSIFFDECSSCSTENGVVRHKYVFCDTGVGGSVGESAVFLATKCREEGDCETDSGTVVLTDQTFSPAWRELSLRDDADKALKEREDLFHGFR